MQIKQEQRQKKPKAARNRFTKFGIAAACLVLVFLIAGACTLGGFSSPGSAYYLPAEQYIVYYLDFREDENGDTASLASVYVNVGAVYTDIGDTFTLEFRHGNASGSYTNGKFSSAGMGKITLANIYQAPAEDTEGEEAADTAAALGTNYGWVKAFDYTEDPVSYSSYRLVRVAASCDMLLYGISFVDTQGKVIPAYTAEADVRGFFGSSYWPSYRDLFRANDRSSAYGALGEPAALTDGAAPAAGDTAYLQFTQEEKYTLLQMDNIRLGSIVADGTYNASTDFGPLAALLPMLGTLVFGVCPFGLRIVPLLCTAGLLAVLYFFGKELLRRPGWGFLLAALTAFGGLALTVGRLGLAYAPIALCVVAAYWCMFRFFRRGVSAAKPAAGACSVLASGLCFALAMALDPKCIFALLGLAGLFAAGMVRQKRKDAAALAKVRAAAAEGEEANASAAPQYASAAPQRAADAPQNASAAPQGHVSDTAQSYALDTAQSYALDTAQSYARRLAWLFAVLGFIAATVAFIALAFLPQYFTYMQLYEADPSAPSLGFFTLLFRALGDAFAVSDVTALSAANAASCFGWLIGFKGATLFSAGEGGTYIALNAQANYAMLLVALVGFVWSTVYTLRYAFCGGQKRRDAGEFAFSAVAAYCVLTAGSLTSLLQYAFCGGANAAQSMLFYAFFFGYIPLLFALLRSRDASAPRVLFGIRTDRTGILLACACALFIVVFALTLPMQFCIPLAEGAAAAMFGWTTLANNGVYRI